MPLPLQLEQASTKSPAGSGGGRKMLLAVLASG